MSAAIARASHSVAWLCLVVAAASLCAMQVDHPRMILWPAMLALVPMAASLAILASERTFVRSVAYLAIGAVSTFWYSSTLVMQLGSEAENDSFLIGLPKFALVMVGGVASGSFAAFLWVVAGYLTAEGAVLLAHLGTGMDHAFDFPTFAAAALVSVVLGTVAIRDRISQRVQPFIHRAARDEELATVRYRLELRAAALMHDTVLSQLAGIAAAPTGELSSRMRQSVERDLEVLVGEEWLAPPPAGSGPLAGGGSGGRGGHGDRGGHGSPHYGGASGLHDAAGDESAAREEGWHGSALADAVETCRRDGLNVDVSGDLSLVGLLEPDVAREVALAVRQCLVNVLVHAGTDNAEVVVFGSEADITLMVIDGGMGFSEADTASDRMGLRGSVRGRIAHIGGTVDVWSTPGQGTSVLIQVPKAPSRDATAEPGPSTRSIR